MIPDNFFSQGKNSQGKPMTPYTKKKGKTMTSHTEKGQTTNPHKFYGIF